MKLDEEVDDALDTKTGWKEPCCVTTMAAFDEGAESRRDDGQRCKHRVRERVAPSLRCLTREPSNMRRDPADPPRQVSSLERTMELECSELRRKSSAVQIAKDVELDREVAFRRKRRRLHDEISALALMQVSQQQDSKIFVWPDPRHIEIARIRIRPRPVDDRTDYGKIGRQTTVSGRHIAGDPDPSTGLAIDP